MLTAQLKYVMINCKRDSYTRRKLTLQKDKFMKEENVDIRKILQIKNIYNQILAKKFKTENLTSSYAVFAEAISKKEFYSQQELTNYVGCNKAHTSRTLLKMQLKCLILPLRPKQPITLTEKGKEFAEKVKQSKTKLFNELFKGVSQEDAQIFEKVLKQIIENSKVEK